MLDKEDESDDIIKKGESLMEIVTSEEISNHLEKLNLEV
jgi:hypothetical protein